MRPARIACRSSSLNPAPPRRYCRSIGSAAVTCRNGQRSWSPSAAATVRRMASCAPARSPRASSTAASRSRCPMTARRSSSGGVLAGQGGHGGVEVASVQGEVDPGGLQLDAVAGVVQQRTCFVILARVDQQLRVQGAVGVGEHGRFEGRGGRPAQCDQRPVGVSRRGGEVSGQGSVQVQVDHVRRASQVLQVGHVQVFRSAVEVDPVELGQCRGQVGVDHGRVVDDVDRSGAAEGGVGELEGLGAVAGPGPDQGQ